MNDAGPHILTIFGEALDCSSPAEQATYLDRVCGGDTALRSRVEALLRAHQQAGGFLQGPPAQADRGAPATPGTVLGPYKVVEPIGEGGFGVVFLAEQQSPVRRLVALKLIKPGMDSKQVIARFEAERQALALMDHPNIARVLDAGETPPAHAGGSPRPYFVMELVKGVPITEFCDQNHLPPRQRLELFVSVCSAVQHAHQKGVIHRDLKPSNVLVTLYDGVPVVKVIDFGIAKAIDQRLTDKTLITGFAQVVGTPLYMSPEQVELSGLDIDTRSDIYSLGVLLYELLTGTTPFDRDRLSQASFDELRRILREEEPPRPSTRISTLGPAAATISDRRRTAPKRLGQLVRGELDWIAMKCLEKDRDRRYATAAALARDVERYLADEPVEAGPPSAGYRLSKLIRKHRRLLLTSGAFLGLLLAASGGAGWQAVRLSRSERASAAAMERRSQDLHAALEQGLELRGQARASKEIARDPWADSLALARRMETLVEGGPVEPGLAERVREFVGDLEREAGDQRMLRTLERLRLNESRIERGVSFSDPSAYPAAFRAYGLDVDALPVAEVAQRIRGAAIHEELIAALGVWVRMTPANDPRQAILMAVIDAADDNEWRRALRRASHAKDVARLRQLAQNPQTSQQPPADLTFLGRLLNLADLREEAVTLLRAAQERHPSDFWMNTQLGMALLYSRPPQPAAAVGYFRAAVALRPDVPGAHVNLGTALGDLRDLNGAAACFRKAVEQLPHFVEAHFNLGIVLKDLGDLPGAAACFREALSLDPNAAPIHHEMGATLIRQKDFAGAVTSFRRSVELDPRDPSAHLGLGIALWGLGDRAGGVTALRRGTELHPKDAQLQYNLGCRLLEQAELGGAAKAFRRAITLDPKHAESHCNLGTALMRSGEFRAAVKSYQTGHELGAARPGWPYPSPDWIRECQRLVSLEDKLPTILRGEARPAGAEECLGFVDVCRYQQRYATALRFLEEAFAADARTAEHETGRCYLGARLAALAAAGRGRDASGLGEKERVRLRRQSRAWLDADLARLREFVERGPAAERARVRQLLERWEGESALTGVRDAEPLSRLPADEASAWRKFWRDVAELRARH